MSNQNHTIDKSKRHPSHIAYAVRDYDGGSEWNRIGVSWESKDGEGFVLQLNAVPLDGRIVLRTPKDK